MGAKAWEVWSGSCRGGQGVTYFFDVKKGHEGLRLVVTQTFPSGLRRNVTVPQADAAAFVGELLKAVSAMAPQTGSPPQHPPSDVAKQRKDYPRAYAPWTAEEDAQLVLERAQGHGIAHLARTFQRHPGAISSRLKVLGDARASQPTAVRHDVDEPKP